MPLSEEKLSDLQLREDCYGDSSVKSKVTESGLSQHRHRDRHHYHQHHSRHSHLDSKSAADQKHTAPLLTSPPGLIRRFADCDLTGDCQINETAPLESELPTGSSIPGDNRFSQTSTKLLVSGSGWRGRLFRTLKKTVSEGGEKLETDENAKKEGEEEVSEKWLRFKPLKDIFHLYGKTRLVRRLSFLDE
ncbi:conserved hypothetical protein [Echinococcus multilocularis]|uniref:Uncharacterized protein n=1 Tax=Echinococcus multilocularis TaxID=6211 RepID=A0A068YGK7_ECHMU|nr:conserved hypothetical protein [Echinococcus multilocularis]